MITTRITIINILIIYCGFVVRYCSVKARSMTTDRNAVAVSSAYYD